MRSLDRANYWQDNVATYEIDSRLVVEGQCQAPNYAIGGSDA